MSATKQNIVVPNAARESILGICVILFLGAAVWGSVIGFIIYCVRNAADESLHAFHTHFAPLLEIHGMYNISAPNASWQTIQPSGFTSWSRIGSDSPPETLLELTTNLLLKSVTKQHALESKMETLERKMESQGQFVQLFALGFAIVLVVNAVLMVLMGFLWKRTSGITK